MGALAEAANRVETSWCQGSMRLEKEARDMGDTYCAAGALAASLPSLLR